MGGKDAFTLIELLVVVAIIAILAAILFPVFIAAKEHSHQARCIANLKQLGSGFLMYMDDNNGYMVAATRWDYVPYMPSDWCGSQYQYPVYPEIGQLWRYCKTRNVYRCPSDNGIAPKDPAMAGVYKNYALSYSMNSYISRVKIESARNQRRSKIMLLIHESRDTINDGKFSMVSTDIPSKVHNDGTTALYVDGHAKKASQTALKLEKAKNYWDPNR